MVSGSLTHVALQVPIDQAAQNVQFSERIFGNTNVTVALYSGIVSTEQSGALAETTTDSDLVPHGAVACTIYSAQRVAGGSVRGGL